MLADWDALRFFLAAARSGSLKAAAQMLAVSQPTVGRRIAALEERLGVVTFNRLPDGIALTEAGNAILSLAIIVEESVAALSRTSSRFAASRSGPVRITAITSLCKFITMHMREFCVGEDVASIELLEDSAIYSLARREADIAVRIRRAPTAGDLYVRVAGKIAFAPYCAVQLMRDESNLATLPLIGFPEASSNYRQHAWLVETYPDRQISVRLNSVDLRFSAARSSLGIAVLPCFVGDACPELARVAPPPDSLTEDIFMLVHKEVVKTQAIRRVADLLFAVFKKHRNQLRGELM